MSSTFIVFVSILNEIVVGSKGSWLMMIVKKHFLKLSCYVLDEIPGNLISKVYYYIINVRTNGTSFTATKFIFHFVVEKGLITLYM